MIQNFKRTLSKKEKKKEKKREKEFARIPDGDEQALGREDGYQNMFCFVNLHLRQLHHDGPQTGSRLLLNQDGKNTLKLGTFAPQCVSVSNSSLHCSVVFFFCWRRENNRLAAEVYKDMPETSFTRTISNPEVVMKRRRQQKLEKRMQEFMSSDGRPDSGKSLDLMSF